MTKKSITSEQRYSKIVKTLLGTSSATLGAGKKGFGSGALQINQKIFAMLLAKRRFVVKLPRQRVDALMAAGSGQRFDPGHGRVMKEWLELDPTAHEDWLALAREALAFVSSQRRTRV